MTVDDRRHGDRHLIPRTQLARTIERLDQQQRQERPRGPVQLRALAHHQGRIDNSFTTIASDF